MTQSDGAQRGTIALDGTRLRELRRQHGLSQETLADRAGLSLTTVARLESRPTSPCRGRFWAGSPPRSARSPKPSSVGTPGQSDEGQATARTSSAKDSSRCAGAPAFRTRLRGLRCQHNVGNHR